MKQLLFILGLSLGLVGCANYERYVEQHKFYREVMNNGEILSSNTKGAYIIRLVRYNGQVYECQEILDGRYCKAI